jgi:hypothetical protein
MLFENIVLGALFFVLVPGILVSLPRGGSKFTVAFVHAVVFVLAYMVLQYFAGYGGYDYMVYDDVDEEGFQDKRAMVDKYKYASEQCDRVKLEQTAVCSTRPKSDYCRKLKGEQERLCQNAMYAGKDLTALGIRW